MDHKTRLKKYGSVFWAILIVIAISIGSFIYSIFVTHDPDAQKASNTVTINITPDGTAYVNPGEAIPSGPPNFSKPIPLLTE